MPHVLIIPIHFRPPTIPNIQNRIQIATSLAGSLINFRGPHIQALLSKGLSVHIAIPEISKDIHSYFQTIGVQAHELPIQRTSANPFKDLYTQHHSYRLIKNIYPQIFRIYTVKPISYGLIAAILLKVLRKEAPTTDSEYAFIGPKKLIKIIINFHRRALTDADIQ